MASTPTRELFRRCDRRDEQACQDAQDRDEVPGLVVVPDVPADGGGTLFLTNTRESFTPNRLIQLVRNYFVSKTAHPRWRRDRWRA